MTIVGNATVDICNTLSFKGMRGGEITAVTVPALVTPKGHPNAVDGRYPWAGGGSTVAKAGLFKVAKVRGIFGPDWEGMVTAERLRVCEALDADGNPVAYQCDAPRNGTKWVVNGDGDRLAFKSNADDTMLYAPIVVVASLGHVYHDANGNEVPRDMVTPFLRDRSNEGRRQGLSSPLVYRDYRHDHIVSVRIGNALTWGDARRLAEALAIGDSATARMIADALMPSEKVVTG